MIHEDTMIRFDHSGITYRFCENGEIAEFCAGDIRLNCFMGRPGEDSCANIWLRIYNGEAIAQIYPLWGGATRAKLYQTPQGLCQIGQAGGVSYRIEFSPGDCGWFFLIELSGQNITCDLLYGQDVGLAARGGVLTNELYIAQYLGHSVFEGENGYFICSRQNQAQSGDRHPVLEQGMQKGKVVAFTTDATQFFGLSYKDTNIPEAFYQKKLESRNKQFELSYIGLQSEQYTLCGKTEAAFYAQYQADMPDAVKNPLDKRSFSLPAYSELNQCEERRHMETNACRGAVYSSPEMNMQQIDELWPDRRLEEWEDGKLLSFFTPDYAHVALKEKEIRCERPHGCILMTKPDTTAVNSNVMTSTNYMYGLFNAQTVIGNTTMHKLISPARGLLNQIKGYGQRIWVEIDGAYRLLTLPAAYEMGMNYATWTYILPDDIVTVRVFAASTDTVIILDVKCKKARDFLITTQLVMGDQEFEQEIKLEKIDGVLRARPCIELAYPALHYDLSLSCGEIYGDDSFFYVDQKQRNPTLLVSKVIGECGFQFIIKGRLEETVEKALKTINFDVEKEAFQQFYQTFTGNFLLDMPEADQEIKKELQRLNTIFWWYAHNAWIHFAAPHGLEQPGGAAWGTRDVCQGPFELFMATGHYTLTRAVLLRIFSKQSKTSGEWPQWFMFDRYDLNAGECHGDVVFWPLKCIADYLTVTRDYSILTERVCWLDHPEEDILLDHVKLAATQYQARFLPGTFLLSYAGGDWDDTLQPADETMRDRLVSAWTQALGFQTAQSLSVAIEQADPGFAAQLQETAENMQKDFMQRLVINGIVAGFVYQEDNGRFQPMLHPNDTQTGIRYRLLPQTRSIIAEMVSPEQMRRNLEVVQDKLYFPDGAHLMDRPAQYNGGVSKLFLRAEQAANVGREISTQYVHAHIRTIEAFAKVGQAEDVWKALFNIHPILLKENVPNAIIRQSNLYFSSSDGLFMDRYAFSAGFSGLKSGEVKVKGGWRLYSSGPGIYLNQLLSNVLGIRVEGDYLIIDPVLPRKLDGLCLRYRCFGTVREFIFQFEPRNPQIQLDGKAVQSEPVNNPYRSGGFKIRRCDLGEHKKVQIRIPLAD